MRDQSPKSTQAEQVERDARGQFAPKQAGGKNNGVADAKPRVINRSEDATVHNRPPERKSDQQDNEDNEDND